MRTARIKESGDAYYHIMSRIIDRRYLLNTQEKERFRRLMRATEAFSGVQILTHAILDNHFHILLHVPERGAVSDREFVRRLGCLYDSQMVKGLSEVSVSPTPSMQPACSARILTAEPIKGGRHGEARKTESREMV
jgi:hypothetical protein